MLGPTLFIFFINDLPEEFECQTKIFADDTKAYAKVDESEESKFFYSIGKKLRSWWRGRING